MRVDILQKQIIRDAIDTFGEEHQIDLWFEESAELTKELCKARRGIGNPLAIAEEIADCKIMLHQLEMIYGNRYLVKDFVNAKLKRLEQTVKEEKQKNAD